MACHGNSLSLSNNCFSASSAILSILLNCVSREGNMPSLVSCHFPNIFQAWMNFSPMLRDVFCFGKSNGHQIWDLTQLHGVRVRFNIWTSFFFCLLKNMSLGCLWAGCFVSKSQSKRDDIIAMGLRGAVRSRNREQRNTEKESRMPLHVEGIYLKDHENKFTTFILIEDTEIIWDWQCGIELKVTGGSRVTTWDCEVQGCIVAWRRDAWKRFVSEAQRWNETEPATCLSRDSKHLHNTVCVHDLGSWNSLRLGLSPGLINI